MRLVHLAAVAACLSLVRCTFDGTGLGGTASSDPQTSEAPDTTTTEDPTTSTTDPTTVGGQCSNFQLDDGEDCDNGPNNNGMNGSICKVDCSINECGDGYLASNEGCDDGNKVNGDDCDENCELEGCGDGAVGPGEDCDDANQDNTDQCTNLCRNPACGDGFTNGDEPCDDGNALDSDGCLAGCVMARCGDGVVWEGVESCDDGNDVDDDECSNNCAAASCGDGMVQAGEECDDANDVETDACLQTCVAAKCGDGQIFEGTEQCDDGNPDPDDGCSATCQDEVCGNGVKEWMEVCDDGNDMDNDDCLSDCSAVAECGDGIEADQATPPEECDDGNDVNDDACTNMCKDAECGDGILQDPEECDDANATPNDTCDNSCNRIGYMVFVTSMKFSGDLGGLAGADEKCNAAATAGKLPGAGNYMAWLSDDADSAADRLFHSNIKYRMPNKGDIAGNWAELTDGGLAIPLKVTELNQSVNDNPANCAADGADNALVWTGTQGSGMGVMDRCSEWADGTDGEVGAAGLLNKTMNGEWTQSCPQDCDVQARLYCIEQPPPP